MRVHVVAVGERMPAWVSAGFATYAQRLPAHCALHLQEVPAGKRGKNADIQRVLDTEGARLLALLPATAYVIALERSGRTVTSTEWARLLADWLQHRSDVAFLIGGPEGLAPACLARADAQWSLSALTLPHALVRVVLAEQIYRAWSQLNGLPYHRGA